MKNKRVGTVSSSTRLIQTLAIKAQPQNPLQLNQGTRMEAGQARAVAPSYIGWSIFNTLCCCLPLGIAALICSCKVQEANSLGQTDRAMDASRTAKMLNIIALVCGIIFIIIFIALRATDMKEH